MFYLCRPWFIELPCCKALSTVLLILKVLYKTNVYIYGSYGDSLAKNEQGFPSTFLLPHHPNSAAAPLQYLWVKDLRINKYLFT